MNLNNRTGSVEGATTRLALVVEYDGTKYCGFQWQSNGSTIQDELEKALQKLTGECVRIAAASRTDSGVHAEGQVVSFLTSSKLSPETFTGALNFHLPDDVSVRKSVRVPNEFNPKRDAVSRCYRYTILNRSVHSPLRDRFSHRIGEKLDVAAMSEASKYLIGTHDFAVFAGSLDDDNASTVRNVFNVEISSDGDLVTANIEANAFLPQQVRRTVGALVEVGLGKSSVKEFQQLIDKDDPGTAGPTLPAKGLGLMKVNYSCPYFED